MKYEDIFKTTPIEPPVAQIQQINSNPNPLPNPVTPSVNLNSGIFSNMNIKTFQSIYNNKLLMTGTYMSVLLIGGLISFVGCSFIYKSMRDKYTIPNHLTDSEVDKIVEMERKFLEKKKKEEKEKERMKQLGIYYNDYIVKYKTEDMLTKDGDFNESCYIQEYTPDGGVILKYNVKSDVFWYWSDGMIRYRILDTVARKFCTVFQCRNIYMDIEKEKEEKKNENENENENEEEKEKEKEEKEKEVKQEEEEEDDSFLFIDSKRVKDVNNRENNKPIEEEKNTLSLSNKKIYFIRKGSVRDFSDTLKQATHVPTEKQLSYEDFKQFMIK